jgi:tRNA threonylcarbamoyladenosine biosynthesis protein TsaE
LPSATSILETRNAAWPDEAACAESALSVARKGAIRNAFVELLGPLGAGKTTFARHLPARPRRRRHDQSPTYTLMEPYRASAARGGFEIAHCDFYRFDDPGEWEDAGFRDVFAAPGLKIVEWPEKAEGLLPRCDLRVSITPSDRGDARSARFEALSETGRELLP